MDMGGWDVIYASDVARLNAVLAQSSQQLIPSFSYSDDNLGLSFHGTFGPWSIRPGGSANRINLQVPIKEGVLNAGGFSNFPLNGLEPVLNVALTLVEGKSANTNDLAFDFRDTTTTPGAAKDGAVYIANPDESGLLKQRDPSGTIAAMLDENLPKCFIANAGKISFVFASVFMDPQGQPWLKPKGTGISYFGSADGSIQAIAIKTITQSPWGTDGLSAAVDPGLLRPGQSLFYTLSQAVFMKNLLLPAIPKAIGNGVSESVFRFNGPSQPNQQNSCSITNAQEFSTTPVENAGTHYYPKITSFTVAINNNRIVTTASGRFDVTGLAGAWVEFNNLQVVNDIYYDQNARKIVFELVSKTTPSTNEHIPWEYWLLGLGGLIGLIIRAIIAIVVTTVETAVQDALAGEGDLSVVNVPLATAVWTGLKAFDIDQADLEQSLVIRGKNNQS